jgi:hypothetical protein
MAGLQAEIRLRSTEASLPPKVNSAELIRWRSKEAGHALQSTGGYGYLPTVRATMKLRRTAALRDKIVGR